MRYSGFYTRAGYSILHHHSRKSGEEKMTEQELAEKIAIHLAFTIRYFDPLLPIRTHWSEFTIAEQTALIEQAKPILALIKEAGYVKLAGNQSLPINPLSASTSKNETERWLGYNQAQRDMLRTVWRKVEQG